MGLVIDGVDEEERICRERGHWDNGLGGDAKGYAGSQMSWGWRRKL